jgi:hypothetical protein
MQNLSIHDRGCYGRVVRESSFYVQKASQVWTAFLVVRDRGLLPMVSADLSVQQHQLEAECGPHIAVGVLEVILNPRWCRRVPLVLILIAALVNKLHPFNG